MTIIILSCFFSLVGCSRDRIGIMFLNEVALGKEQHISTGNGSLTQAPKGYDSIVAKGRTEPGILLHYHFPLCHYYISVSVDY
jgi:hypothetical protein